MKRFPKHLGSQELFEFVVDRHVTDAKLFNSYSAVPYTSIKTLAQCFKSFSIISFLKINRGENPKHSGS